MEETTGETHTAVAAVEEAGFDRQVWERMSNLDLTHSRAQQGQATCRVFRVIKNRVRPWSTQACICLLPK